MSKRKNWDHYGGGGARPPRSANVWVLDAAICWAFFYGPQFYNSYVAKNEKKNKRRLTPLVTAMFEVSFEASQMEAWFLLFASM